jgi:AbrB family looped-hinge helix DNA binding protein
MIDHMEARMDSRGRVTIPAEIRRKFGIKPGTKLIVREEEGRIVVTTFAQYVRSLRGVLRGKGLIERLREERRSERLRENEQARPRTECYNSRALD